MTLVLGISGVPLGSNGEVRREIEIICHHQHVGDAATGAALPSYA